MFKIATFAIMIKGILPILLCYIGGMIISHLINGVVSAGVVGMLLLFLALSLKACKPHFVAPVAHFFVDRLLLFFLPAAVGIMEYGALLHNHIWAIIIAATLSTVWVLWLTGYLTQKWEKRS